MQVGSFDKQQVLSDIKFLKDAYDKQTNKIKKLEGEITKHKSFNDMFALFQGNKNGFVEYVHGSVEYMFGGMKIGLSSLIFHSIDESTGKISSITLSNENYKVDKSSLKYGKLIIDSKIFKEDRCLKIVIPVSSGEKDEKIVFLISSIDGKVMRIH